MRYSRIATQAGIALLIVVSQQAKVQAQGQGFVTGNVGGVFIDPNGVIKETRSLSKADQQKILKIAQAATHATGDVTKFSKLRKVSLNRLEEKVRALHQTGESIPAELQLLAGLQQIQYVLFFEDPDEVILAGPAEGWQTLTTGEIVGRTSNRPVMQLEDLIVALRYAFATGIVEGFMGCSIEPTQEGQTRLEGYLRRLGGRMDRGRIRQIMAGMEQAAGPQQVLTFGVPESSRFAFTMVAADYRLKRIALGHDPAPNRMISSYLDLAAQRLRSNAPQRQHQWWFISEFDSIRSSPDASVWEFDGQALRVMTGPSSNPEQNSPPHATSPSATKFANDFTRQLPAIARRIPVFADLQNLVSLSVAAELIARRVMPREGSPALSSQPGSATSGSWQPDHFLDEEDCSIIQYRIPRQATAISNYRFVRGRFWLISVSGGVEIRPTQMLDEQLQRGQTDATLANVADRNAPPDSASNWWWD